jgi:hypothetical protein
MLSVGRDAPLCVPRGLRLDPVEWCRLKALDPMLGAANCRLALTPIAKPRATATHDAACRQYENLSSAAARTADELKENSS